MPGLLYPAYQKFYNALSNLERFNKEANFFDNISCLDNFFSEYRSITFVMQKSLKHTEYFEVYEKNRDIFLTDHWFVVKRNETEKQQPFQLVKDIIITTYLPYHGFQIGEATFTVENDISLRTLYDDIRKELSKSNAPEIFFSVSYSFHEKDSEIDLLKKLLSGTSSMQQFLEAMDQSIGEKCLLCEQIKDKMNSIRFSQMPCDFLLTDDYVFYTDSGTFERGGRAAMLMEANGQRLLSHRPITELTNAKYFNFDKTPFGSFTLMHASLRFNKPGSDIMPAFMIVYVDGTYDMEVFHADMKTTFYRKFNETAQLVKEKDVQEVCFMGLYAVAPLNDTTSEISNERVKASTADILVCASIDNQLREKEYVFDGKEMEQPAYVADVMKTGMSNHLNCCRTNFYPIWKAFKEKYDKTAGDK